VTTPLVDLRVNGKASPVGLSGDTVRFAWRPAGDVPDDGVFTLQAAVRPADLHAGVGLLVHADCLSSDTRAYLAPMPADRIVWWRVGFSSAGRTTWSPPERFTTAPDLAATGALWITHPDLLGGSVDARTVWFGADIVARPDDLACLLHVATPGVVDVRLDGEPVGNHVLGPGYCDLWREVPAATYDLGSPAPGPHTITIEVAPGPFWIPPGERYAKFAVAAQSPILLAVVEQVGPSPLVTRSGPTFACGRGATVGTHWYGGEDHDAGLPEPWQTQPSVAAVAVPVPEGRCIWWPQYPPIGVVQSLSPRTTAGHDPLVVDFGVNIAGLPELDWAPSSSARQIVVLPAEVIDPHTQRADQASTGQPIFDTVTVPVGHYGQWRPRFTYHGFRYLEVRGAGATPVSVGAHVVRASNTRAGGFQSEDGFLQTLHDIVDRAIQNNMASVFTDCPHREKLGWLEQLHLCFDALVRNWDVEAHLRDVLHHVRTSQLPSGDIPSTAPEFVDFTGNEFLGDASAFRFDVNWGGVIGLLPLYHYRQYGDVRVLHENLPALKAYLSHLRGLERHGALDFGLGDWVGLDPTTPRDLVATYGYLRLLNAARAIARIVGDEPWYGELTGRTSVVARALRRFEQCSATASQTRLALLVDLADARGDVTTSARLYTRLLDCLTRLNAFTVGEVGIGPLLDVLHRHGRDDLINRIIRRPDVPGYGMQLHRGVTALAETWSAGAGPEGEGSNDHFMLGMIDHWLHKHVAGLRQADDSVAWRDAVVEPVFLAGVPGASSTHLSPTGTYRVAWVRSATSIEVTAEVPPGGSASLRLPGLPRRTIGPGRHVAGIATPGPHEETP